jgi:hypothetical protein
MKTAVLETIRALIEEDINRRGLSAAAGGLCAAYPDDFARACASLAGHDDPTLAIVTGFFIPTGQPPGGETDGPLGAVFLARALQPLGIRVVIATDDFCANAIQAGLNLSGLRKQVPVVVLPSMEQASAMTVSEYHQFFRDRTGAYTHLLALERAGPSHTPESLRAQDPPPAAIQAFAETVPPEDHDCCHTMRGRDITNAMSPAQRLFEHRDPAVITIGIGDGGNEIGMGKITWDAIRQNTARGGLIACRVATQHLIVCGVSNWGAYGLAAGVRLLRAHPLGRSLFNPDKEYEILECMVDAGPLVDGVSGLATPTVDGLDFDRYAETLKKILALQSP